VRTIALSTRPEIPLEPVDEVLRSHVRMHAADGEVLRDVRRWAAGHGDRPVVSLLERDVTRMLAAELATTEDELTVRLSALGKTVGPPWHQEQKAAAPVAWMVLARD